MIFYITKLIFYSKNRIIFLLLVSLSTHVIAQSSSLGVKKDSKIAVVLFSKSFTDYDDDTDYTRIVAEKVTTAFVSSRRFSDVIDRTDFGTVMDELHLQKDAPEAFVSLSVDQLAEYGKSLRAEFIVTGNIFNVNSVISLTGSYRGIIGFNLKVIEVNSRRIHASASFEVVSSSTLSPTGHSSKQQALSAAIVNIEKDVFGFIDIYFPILANYVRDHSTRSKGRVLAEFVVDAGVQRGIRKNQKVDILRVEEGEPIPEFLGEGKVIELQPNSSIIKIIARKDKTSIELIESKQKSLKIRSKVE